MGGRHKSGEKKSSKETEASQETPKSTRKSQRKGKTGNSDVLSNSDLQLGVGSAVQSGVPPSDIVSQTHDTGQDTEPSQNVTSRKDKKKKPAEEVSLTNGRSEKGMFTRTHSLRLGHLNLLQGGQLPYEHSKLRH